MISTLQGSCEDAIKPLVSAQHPVGIQKVGGIAITLFLPGPLSASLTGLAEAVRCDLQPVDNQVTYITSQVPKGCVAQVPNATVEVHVLFLEFPRVSARWQGRVGTERWAQASGMRGVFLGAVAGAVGQVLIRDSARRETCPSHRACKQWHFWGQHGAVLWPSPRGPGRKGWVWPASEWGEQVGSGVDQVSCGSCVPNAGSSSADTALLEAALTLRKFFPPWSPRLPPWNVLRTPVAWQAATRRLETSKASVRDSPPTPTREPS